jgi:hypothetical protein
MSLTQEFINDLLTQELSTLSVSQRRREFYETFSPAAVFLLAWEHSNLFDPTGDSINLSCKGCGAIVPRWGMAEHHRTHKNSYLEIREN